MHFNFLNPVVLWAIPLSLLPVLFHFLFRRPPKIVPFSDLRFLVNIYLRYRPRKRLLEWLLLLFRILMLLCLFLFFSRPVLHWGGSVGAEDSVALVILLDASGSMRYQESGRSYWNRAVALADSALHSLRDTDRSALLIYSDKIHYFSGFLTNEHQKLSEKLAEFQPAYRNTNLLPPLQVAYHLLSNSGASNKTILALSDMGRHGLLLTRGDRSDFPNWEPLIKNFDPAVRILYSKFPEKKRNVAVESVKLVPDLYSGQVKAEVKLKNWGGEAESNLPVFLDSNIESAQYKSSLNGIKRESEVLVNLEPLEEKTVLLTASLLEGKSHAGAVGIRTDPLAADDFFFFTQFSPQKVKVLCVEEPSGIAAFSGESYFLRQALTIPPSPYEIRTISFNELKKMSLNEYQTVILINPGILDIEALQLLAQHLKNGGSLFLTLGERSAPYLSAEEKSDPFSAEEATGLPVASEAVLARGFMPRASGDPKGRPLTMSPEDIVPNEAQVDSFFQLLPCALQEFRQTSELSLLPAADIEYEEFASIKTEYDWTKIKAHKIVQPVLKENGEGWGLASPWILFSDGTPLLLFSKDQKVAVWTSSIDRSWNNFSSKPLYVPLMRCILKNLNKKGGVELASHYTVGQSFKKQFPVWKNKESLRLFSPSDQAVDFVLTQRELSSLPLEETGLYTLIDSPSGSPSSIKILRERERSDEKELTQKFAVNMDQEKEESSLGSISDQELSRLLPRTRFQSLDTGAQFSEQLSAAVRGKEFSRFFLVLTSFFLLGEISLLYVKK